MANLQHIISIPILLCMAKWRNRAQSKVPQIKGSWEYKTHPFSLLLSEIIGMNLLTTTHFSDVCRYLCMIGGVFQPAKVPLPYYMSSTLCVQIPFTLLQSYDMSLKGFRKVGISLLLHTLPEITLFTRLKLLYAYQLAHWPFHSCAYNCMLDRHTCSLDLNVYHHCKCTLLYTLTFYLEVKCENANSSNSYSSDHNNHITNC